MAKIAQHYRLDWNSPGGSDPNDRIDAMSRRLTLLFAQADEMIQFLYDHSDKPDPVVDDPFLVNQVFS